MSTTSILLGKSASPHVLEHEGRVYQFRALSQHEKTIWERWLIARARDAIRTIYEGDDLARELRALKDEATSTPAYDFHGDLSSAVMGTPAGVLKLASIIMGCDESEVLPLWAARQAEVKHLVELVIAESFPRMPDDPRPGEPEKNESVPAT